MFVIPEIDCPDVVKQAIIKINPVIYLQYFLTTDIYFLLIIKPISLSHISHSGFHSSVEPGLLFTPMA